MIFNFFINPELFSNSIDIWFDIFFEPTSVLDEMDQSQLKNVTETEQSRRRDRGYEENLPLRTCWCRWDCNHASIQGWHCGPCSGPHCHWTECWFEKRWDNFNFRALLVIPVSKQKYIINRKYGRARRGRRVNGQTSVPAHVQCLIRDGSVSPTFSFFHISPVSHYFLFHLGWVNWLMSVWLGVFGRYPNGPPKRTSLALAQFLCFSLSLSLSRLSTSTGRTLVLCAFLCWTGSNSFCWIQFLQIPSDLDPIRNP